MIGRRSLTQPATRYLLGGLAPGKTSARLEPGFALVVKPACASLGQPEMDVGQSDPHIRRGQARPQIHRRKRAARISPPDQQDQRPGLLRPCDERLGEQDPPAWPDQGAQPDDALFVPSYGRRRIVVVAEERREPEAERPR